MPDILHINLFIQTELERRCLQSVAPDEAARWLDGQGLLKLGTGAPGLPLRKLLRRNEIVGAHQAPNRRWTIRRSKSGLVDCPEPSEIPLIGDLYQRHVLPDLIGSNPRVVFVGTAAGSRSAATRAYYAGPGNKFWSVLFLTGLTPRLLRPADYQQLAPLGVGLTDLAKTVSGNDADIRKDDYDVAAFRARIVSAAPGVVAFNGKKAAATYLGTSTGKVRHGMQMWSVGDASVWILPSTSAAAGSSWDVSYWHGLADSILSQGQQ